jgi:hypothetical protein
MHSSAYQPWPHFRNYCSMKTDHCIFDLYYNFSFCRMADYLKSTGREDIAAESAFYQEVTTQPFQSKCSCVWFCRKNFKMEVDHFAKCSTAAFINILECRHQLYSVFIQPVKIIFVNSSIFLLLGSLCPTSILK